MRPGCKKTGPLCSSRLRKGPALLCLATTPDGCKGPFRSFREGVALRPGCHPEAALCPSWMRLLLFLGSLLRNLLGGCLGGLLCLLRFLGHLFLLEKMT